MRQRADFLPVCRPVPPGGIFGLKSGENGLWREKIIQKLLYFVITVPYNRNRISAADARPI